MGTSLIVLGALVAIAGLEEAITAHLDIPLDLPRYIVVLGALLGFLLGRLRVPGKTVAESA